MNKEKTTIFEQLKLGKPVIVFTKGASMEPLLREGKTHVLIEPLEREAKQDDLPIYVRADGKYVIHRIIGMDECFYYIRGDNCIGIEKVQKDAVLGIVKKIYYGEKGMDVTNTGYRLYVAIWRITAPVRIRFYKLRARIWKYVRKK